MLSLRRISFTTLQRISLALVALCFAASGFAALEFSRRVGWMTEDFVATRLAEDESLRDIELTLAEAMKLHAERSAAPATPLDGIRNMAGAIRVRLDDLSSRSVAAALDAHIDAAIQALPGFVRQRDSDPAYSDPSGEARTAAVEAIRDHLRHARGLADSLGQSGEEIRDTIYFISSRLRELAQSVDSFLAEQPDPMPSVLKRLDTVREELDTLAGLPQFSEETESALLVDFKRTVYSIVGALSRQSQAAPGSPEEAKARETADRLWNKALLDAGAFRTIVRGRLLEHAALMQDSINADARAVLLATVAGLLVSLGLMAGLQSLLKRRVHDLSDGADRLAKGDLDYRLPPGPRDALGRLALDFNVMAQSLEQKNELISEHMRVLRASRELLETRVEERTAELSQALESLRLKDAVFLHANEGIAIADVNGRLVDVNPALCVLSGFSRKELLEADGVARLFSGENPPGLGGRIVDGLTGEGLWDGEILLSRKDGGDAPMWLVASAMLGEDGRATHFVGILRDVTEQRKAREKIVRQASYDFLTGLANRATLMARLEEAVDDANEQSSRLAVLFLDLDNFKGINDSLGHQAGDELLKQAAGRLTACVRGEDLVARLGGDEFVVLAAPIQKDGQAILLANRILAAFTEPFVLGGAEVKSGTSIGVCLYPKGADTPEALIKHADLALYRAKAGGKGIVEVWTPAARNQARHRAGMETELRRALEENRFECRYQPIVMTGRPVIIGAEALARLEKDGVLLPPAEFMPMAREAGLVGEITEQVARKAALELTAWRREGLGGMRLNVNVWTRDFARPGFVERMATLAESTGFPPFDMELELNEEAFAHDHVRTAQIIQALRSLGFFIAVDGFTGERLPLSALQRYPVSTVKIDRRIVENLGHKGTRGVTRAAVAMAKSLGIMVNAVGVETPEQLQFIRANACDFFQGHYFSPAVNAAEFKRLLLAGQAREDKAPSPDAQPRVLQ